MVENLVSSHGDDAGLWEGYQLSFTTRMADEDPNHDYSDTIRKQTSEFALAMTYGQNVISIDATIESEVIYGGNKLEYALSIEDYIASMSILSDLTYDFFATEIESENMLLVKTMNFNDIDSLFKQMKEDLGRFSNLK